MGTCCGKEWRWAYEKTVSARRDDAILYVRIFGVKTSGGSLITPFVSYSLKASEEWYGWNWLHLGGTCIDERHMVYNLRCTGLRYVMRLTYMYQR